MAGRKDDQFFYTFDVSIINRYKMTTIRNIIATLLLLLCIASFVELLHNTREDIIIFLLFTMCSSAIIGVEILKDNKA